jgi:exopolyphosphatase/pppGpp-phosphohydrolase
VPVVKSTLTLAFGTITLANMFVTSLSATEAWSYIGDQLRAGLEAGGYEKKLADLLQRPPTLAIALGSAITGFMRDEIASVTGKRPPLRTLHGRRVDPKAIVQYLEKIQPALDQMQLSPKSFPPESEEATVLSGLVVYATIAQELGIKEYRISRSGMRYGTLASHAGKQVVIEIDHELDDVSGAAPYAPSPSGTLES